MAIPHWQRSYSRPLGPRAHTASRKAYPLKLFAIAAASWLWSSAPSVHAQAASLYAQLPYDFGAQAFDLERLEYPSSPLFSQSFEIPYAELERVGNAELAALPNTFAGDEECPTILCPDAHWDLSVHGGFRFTQWGQPVITPCGSATENGFHIRLDTQVEVSVDAHVDVSLPDSVLPDPGPLDVPIKVLIGIHAEADVKLYPVLELANFEPKFINEGNVEIEIHGGEAAAIGYGAVLGSFLPVVGVPGIGTALGALGGEVALNAAKAKVEPIIQKQVADAIKAAGKQVEDAVNEFVQPKIGQANAFMLGLSIAPIPGIGQTVGQLQTQLGLSFDVRSVTRDNRFVTVVSTRFANTPSTGGLSGRIHFPKHACTYRKDGAGYVRDALIEKPALSSTRCAELVGEDLAHRVLYGANPEVILQSGDPGNDLPAWASMGTLTLSDTVLDEGDAYACDYTLTGLPDAVYAELSIAAGSALEEQTAIVPANLPRRAASPRVFNIAVGGTSVRLDSRGDPLNDDVRNLGHRSPASVGECPSYDLGPDPRAELPPVVTPEDDGACEDCRIEAVPTGPLTSFQTNPFKNTSIHASSRFSVAAETRVGP